MGPLQKFFRQKFLQGNRFKQFFEKLFRGNFVQIRSNFPAKIKVLVNRENISS